MEKIKSYRDLQVWQRAVELGVRVYQVTEGFPKSEQYGLVNQMRRAAVSVASNIAEGYGRSEAEFARYLGMSRGSLAELETQMEIARRVKYLSDSLYAELNEEANILGRQLNVFYHHVSNGQPASRQRLAANRQPPTASR